MPSARVANPDDTLDPQQVLIDNLDLVRSVVKRVARRRGFDAAAADDLESAVWLHLIDHDYRVIRQFGGRSSLRTFLMVVVTRLALDLRCADLGRWRPSRRARRLGKAAMQFETLVFRDGFSSAEAIALMAGDGRSLPRAVVGELMLGRARPRRFVPVDAMSDHLAANDSGTPIEEVERRDAARRVRRALGSALASLGRGERRLLTLRHGRGLKVSHIAETLGEDQKSLYRRLNALHARLRAAIEQQGVSRRDACDYYAL